MLPFFTNSKKILAAQSNLRQKMPEDVLEEEKEEDEEKAGEEDKAGEEEKGNEE